MGFVWHRKEGIYTCIKLDKMPTVKKVSKHRRASHHPFNRGNRKINILMCVCIYVCTYRIGCVRFPRFSKRPQTHCLKFICDLNRLNNRYSYDKHVFLTAIHRYPKYTKIYCNFKRIWFTKTNAEVVCFNCHILPSYTV